MYMGHVQYVSIAYCGWVRNPAPVENGGKLPMILLGFQPSKVVQDFIMY